MNDSIGTFMKSGFPLLFLVLVAMLLVGLWRREQVSRSHKWKWSLIMVIPAILTMGITAALGATPIEMLQGVVTGRQPFIPPWNQFLFQATTFVIFFLPFSGILGWLLIDRG
ncbi:MAG: hypothetical protein AAGM67_18235 [Bacteroidota bacterium]